MAIIGNIPYFQTKPYVKKLVLTKQGLSRPLRFRCCPRMPSGMVGVQTHTQRPCINLLHWLCPPQRCWQNKSFSSLLFPCIRIQNKHFGYDRVFVVTLSSTVRFFPWRGLDFCFEYVSYIAEPSLIDSLWVKAHNLKVHLFLNKNIPFVLYARFDKL